MIDAFLVTVVASDFTEESARMYGNVRADLESAGTPIGPVDTFIAAHALSLGVILVTNNGREFSRVTGLTIEDSTHP